MLVSCRTASPMTQSLSATPLFPGTISLLDWSVGIPVVASPALVPRPPALSHSFARIRSYRKRNMGRRYYLGHFLKHILLRPVLGKRLKLITRSGAFTGKFARHTCVRIYINDLVIFHGRLTQFKLTTKQTRRYEWCTVTKASARRIAESTTTAEYAVVSYR